MTGLLPSAISESRLAAALACLVAALAAGACDLSESEGPAERPPAVVEVVELEPRSLPQVVAAVGSLESPDPTTVSAQIEGDIVSLEAPEGELVERGEVLARIDSRSYEAAVRVARARWQNARQRLERVRAMREEDVSSEQALDDAVAEYEAAAGELEDARTRLSETEIRAPFRGTLGLRRASPGDYVVAGDPIVEITPDADLELRFSVPQRHVGLIEVDQEVHGQVGPCGPRFEGRVTALDPRIDPSSRTLTVEGLVGEATSPDGSAPAAPSPEADGGERSGAPAAAGSGAAAGTAGDAAPGAPGDVSADAASEPGREPARRAGAGLAPSPIPSNGRLAPGMGVRLRVLVGEWPEALVAPREAVVRQGTRTLVYVLDAEDRAQAREVALGAFFPSGVHVREGLEAGDRVVASGHQKLRPDAPTDPRPWEPTRNRNLDLGRFGPVEACGEPFL